MSPLNYANSMCRECGTYCDPISWEDLGGLCWSCAYPKGRSPMKVPVAFVNGVEVEGEANIREAIFKSEPDPIRDAVARAASDFLKDKGGDS